MRRWLSPEEAAAHAARMRRYRLEVAGETSPAVDEANRAKVEAAVLTHGVVPYERDIQAGILELLEIHPRVSWAARLNTGATSYVGKDGSVRFVAFGFRGCSDILGMLKGGRLFAIEVKRPGKDPTPDQLAFLTKVSADGGLAFVARSVRDVELALAMTAGLDAGEQR